MAHPRTYPGNRVARTVRLPDDVDAALVEQADRRQVSVNYLVECAARIMLASWEQDPTPTNPPGGNPS